MRAVVQRVENARVMVGGDLRASIGKGLLVYLGVEDGDTQTDSEYLAEKIVNLRIFEDEHSKMNLSVKDIGGAMLVVSQFTLCGDCRKGRRPSFAKAADPKPANELYQVFCRLVQDMGTRVEAGVFRAHMKVESVNDGPVTILVDSRKQF